MFHYYFGYIRMIHFIAAMVFAVAFAVRDLLGVRRQPLARARSSFRHCGTASWWKGLFSQMKYYLFLKRESDLWVGHNPLAQVAMFAMYTLGTVFIIVTGLALYAEQWGWGSMPMNLMGWVFVLFGDPQMVRTLHHLAMWYLVLFAVIHMYMVFREDIMSGESVIGTMINGIRTWKREPAGLSARADSPPSPATAASVRAPAARRQRTAMPARLAPAAASRRIPRPRGT